MFYGFLPCHVPRHILFLRQDPTLLGAGGAELDRERHPPHAESGQTGRGDLLPRFRAPYTDLQPSHLVSRRFSYANNILSGNFSSDEFFVELSRKLIGREGTVVMEDIDLAVLRYLGHHPFARDEDRRTRRQDKRNGISIPLP